MRSLLTACLAATVVCSGSHATDLITGPESSMWIAPAVYNGKFSAIMGDTSVPLPTWYLAQWNNPSPLPGGQGNLVVQPGQAWQITSPTSYISFYPQPVNSAGLVEHTYEVAQNGGATGAKLACGAEFDMFLSANTGTIYKTPQGGVSPVRFANSAPIGYLSNLTYRFGLNIALEKQVSTGCNINFSTYSVNLTLGNVKGLAMFWGVNLRDSRNLSDLNSTCLGYPVNGVYCFYSTVDEVVQGARQQTPGSRAYWNLSFLPALEAAIKWTADPDPNDWYIAGAYVGQAINGGMLSVSRWDNVVLAAY